MNAVKKISLLLFMSLVSNEFLKFSFCSLCSKQDQRGLHKMYHPKCFFINKYQQI